MKSAELYEIEKLKEMESLVEYLFNRTVKGGVALFERRWRETHKNAEKITVFDPTYRVQCVNTITPQSCRLEKIKE